MRTIIIAIILIIFFGLIVFSVPAGRVYTQTQLNAQDFNSFNFEEHFNGKTRNADGTIAIFTFTTIQKQFDSNGIWTGKYIAVDKNQMIFYPNTRYYACRDQNNSAFFCQNQMKQSMKRTLEGILNTEKRVMTKWKTKTNYNTELDGFNYN